MEVMLPNCYFDRETAHQSVTLYLLPCQCTSGNGRKCNTAETVQYSVYMFESRGVCDNICLHVAGLICVQVADYMCTLRRCCVADYRS